MGHVQMAAFMYDYYIYNLLQLMYILFYFFLILFSKNLDERK